jgi:hypothetical protein
MEKIESIGWAASRAPGTVARPEQGWGEKAVPGSACQQEQLRLAFHDRGELVEGVRVMRGKR